MITTTAPAVPDLLGTAPADLIQPGVELPVATRDEAVRRAERIRAGLVGYAAMRQDIADAYAHRDWQALGYGSWYEYVQAEFGEELRKLDRADRREAVADMRQQGMSTRQIAEATGVSNVQVHRDLKQQVLPDVTPAKVTGSDGKQHPATRPTPAPKPAPATAPNAASSPAPAEPQRPKPPAWDPEERKAHEAEVLRQRDIRDAEQQAKTLVTDVRAHIFTVIQGIRQGAKGLVTHDMIADIRRAVDLLEGEIDDEQ